MCTWTCLINLLDEVHVTLTMKLNKDVIKALGLINQIAIAMMVPIIMCLFAGIYLDNKLDKSPLFLIVFILLGVLAGFRNLFMMTKSFTKDKKRK